MGTIRAGRPKVNLAQLIASTRRDRTQSDLARDAGMSVQSMQQYVGGGYPAVNFPDTRNLKGLARACKVDVGTVIQATQETMAEVLGIDPERKRPDALDPEVVMEGMRAALREMAATLGSESADMDVDAVVEAAAQNMADALHLRPAPVRAKLDYLLPPEAAWLPDDAISAVRSLIIHAGRPGMEQALVRSAAEDASRALTAAEAAAEVAIAAADGDGAARLRPAVKTAKSAAAQAQAAAEVTAEIAARARKVIAVTAEIAAAAEAAAASAEAASEAQATADAGLSQAKGRKPAKSTAKPAQSAAKRAKPGRR
jgi:transcriptional regulator with XRE-family HTH domain